MGNEIGSPPPPAVRPGGTVNPSNVPANQGAVSEGQVQQEPAGFRPPVNRVPADHADTRFGGAPRTSSVLLGAPAPAVGGVNVPLSIPTRSKTGALVPVAPKIPPELRHIIVDPDDPEKGLSMEAVKALTEGKAKHIKKPSDFFKGFLEINTGELLPPSPGLAALSSAMNKPLAIETKNAQYQVAPGKWGNNIVFYSPNHEEIIELVHHPKFKDRGRFIKRMTHFEAVHGEGNPKFAFRNTYSHGGAIIPVIDKNGKKDIAWMDWPTNYGKLGENEYGAQLDFFSLDNIKFTKPLPASWEEHKKSYYETMDTMAALQMLGVQFSSADARDWNTTYNWNILEIDKASRLKEYNELVAKTNDPAAREKLRLWTQYCMEGVFSNANQPAQPINQWAVDNGLLDPAVYQHLKNMEKIFKDAGGWEPGQAYKGWYALRDAGLISSQDIAMLQGLVSQAGEPGLANEHSTKMINVPFKLSREDLRPYTDYGPEGVQTEPGPGQGLVAKPLTITGLVAGPMEINVPYEDIAAKMSDQLKMAVDAANPAQRAQLLGQAAAVAGISDPQALATPQGQAKAIEMFGRKMAAGYQAGVLANQEIRGTIREAIRYELMDEASKEKLDGLWGYPLKNPRQGDRAVYEPVVENPGQSRGAPPVPPQDVTIAELNGQNAVVLFADGQKKTVPVDELSRPMGGLYARYVEIVSNGNLTREERTAKLRALDKEAEQLTVTYGPPVSRTDKMFLFVPPQYGWLVSHGAGGANWPGYMPLATAISNKTQVSKKSSQPAAQQ